MRILQQLSEKCDCSESTLPIPVHDCQYIARRLALIPEAAAYADSKIPDEPGGRLWSRFFSKKMAELMAEQETEAD